MKRSSQLINTFILSACTLCAQAVNSGISPVVAENAWITTPLSGRLEDSVPGPIRELRDLYFDNGIGARQPLTPVSAKNVAVSDGTFPATTPEIPVVTNRKLVVATFASNRPILTASGRAIYTEVSLVVKDVLDTSAPTIEPPQTITLVLPGGAVVTNSGSVLSFLTQPRPHYISPGNTYLLVLSYHPTGEFYTLSKAWDVSSGVVTRSAGPHKPTESLLGLTVEQMTTLLKQQFGGN